MEEAEEATAVLNNRLWPIRMTVVRKDYPFV